MDDLVGANFYCLNIKQKCNPSNYKVNHSIRSFIQAENSEYRITSPCGAYTLVCDVKTEARITSSWIVCSQVEIAR